MNDAMNRLRAAGVPTTTQHIMKRALNNASISATALNVIKTPEILYLAPSFRARMAESGHPAANSPKDFEELIVRVFFVSSTCIGVTYYHVWDSEKIHQQQVRLKFQTGSVICE